MSVRRTQGETWHKEATVRMSAHRLQHRARRGDFGPWYQQTALSVPRQLSRRRVAGCRLAEWLRKSVHNLMLQHLRRHEVVRQGGLREIRWWLPDEPKSEALGRFLTSAVERGGAWYLLEGAGMNQPYTSLAEVENAVVATAVRDLPLEEKESWIRKPFRVIFDWLIQFSIDLVTPS